MKIIIISATEFEFNPSISKIKSSKKYDISFVVTGVGMLATAVRLSRIIYKHKPDLIIQAGIAGCFDINIKLGETVVVKNEFLGDMGVEENNIWKDLFDMKLKDDSSDTYDSPNDSKAIYIKGSIPNKHINYFNPTNLTTVNAITVNQITTQQIRINQLIEKYNPTIESMEGAALHFAGNYFEIPYLQIRSISNYIGERDKSKWRIKEAIENLNIELEKLVTQLTKS